MRIEANMAFLVERNSVSPLSGYRVFNVFVVLKEARHV